MSVSTNDAFAAEIIERGAAGFAGFAASLMIERKPSLRDRYPGDAQGVWKSHLVHRAVELSSALATGHPKLFATRVLWTAKAFSARGADIGDVRLSLEALRDVLRQHMPVPAGAAAIECLEHAILSLGGKLVVDRSELDPARDCDRLALQYLQQVLEGDSSGAIRLIQSAVESGLPVRSAYLEVLLPAQREIGRLWHQNDVAVAEEHLVTATTHRAMAVLAHAAAAAPANGLCAVVAAVASNAHDIGLRAVADLFQIDGWRAIYLGADVPAEDLPSMVAYFDADLLLLGASLSVHLARVAETIKILRADAGSTVRVLVGGSGFNDEPGLWRQLGADGFAATADEALQVGRALVTSPGNSAAGES